MSHYLKELYTSDAFPPDVDVVYLFNRLHSVGSCDSSFHIIIGNLALIITPLTLVHVQLEVMMRTFRRKKSSNIFDIDAGVP